MKIKLQIKLVVIFSSLFIISFSLISFLSYKYSYRILKAISLHHVECPAWKIEQFIKSFISIQKEAIVCKATSIYIKEKLKKINKKTRNYNKLISKINMRLKQMIKGNHRITELFILNMQGKVIASTDTKQIGKNKSDRDYFIKGKKKVFATDIYLSLALKHPTLLTSAPILNNKPISAVMVARIKIEEMAKFVKGFIGRAITEEIYLVNKNGEFLLGSMTEPVEFKKKLISKGINNCINGKSGVKEYVNYKNVPVVGAFRWMDKEEWGLIVEIEQKEAFAVIYKLRNSILFVGFIMTFLIIIIVFVMAGKISQPILKLAEASDKIASGDLNVSVKVNTGDEIEVLANSFNYMVKDLKISRKELKKWGESMDKKVNDKTKELQEKVEELEKFNKFSIDRELKMIELKKEIEDLKNKLKLKV